MENTELLEQINEGMEVVELEPECSNGGLKGVVIGLAITGLVAAGYGAYKGGKKVVSWIKDRKALKAEITAEEDYSDEEVEDEE